MPNALLASGLLRCPIIVSALLVLTSHGQAAETQPPQGFTALFNGKDLAGWHGRPHIDPSKWAALPEAERQAKLETWKAGAKKHWKVDSGQLVNDGDGAYLSSDKDFSDIELVVEYQAVPKADGGIYLRGTGQVRIWDSTKEGGLRPVGEWNFMEVTVRGPTIVTELNGTRILSAELSKVTEFMHNNLHPGKDRTSGHFGFCGHSDPVAFRNVQIKSLERK